MIELTTEQWQAIAQEINPTMIEPTSQTAYVVVRKDEWEKVRTTVDFEADAAHVLRIAWMRRMGLDSDEIADSLRDDPPVSVQEELKQMKALDSLDRVTPPAAVLREYAVKY